MKIALVQEENVAGIRENARELTKTVYDATKDFLLNLSQTCISLLDRFDRLLTIDDVNSGREFQYCILVITLA